jgi:hypothetical protein
LSDELDALKRKAFEAAASSTDLAVFEKAMSIARLSAETEKLRMEAQKLASDKLKTEADISSIRRNERFETARLWLPISVPFLSTIILAGTLIFQVRQFSVTTTMQKEAAEDNRRFQAKTAEDAEWREAIRTLADAKTPESTLAGVTSLRIFLKSPTYKVPARELAFHYLIQTETTDSFKPMFNAIMDIPTWDSLDDYVQINRLLGAAYDNGARQIANLENDNSKSKGKAGVPKSVLQAQENQLYDDLSLTSTQIATILRSPRPNNTSLDLSNTSFYNSPDFRHANFQGANLYNAVFTCLVEGADFTKIQNYDLSQWKYTAWWKAEKIDANMLKYLSDKFYFEENRPYGVTTSAADYKSNLDRLVAQSQQK